jgi:hypothetical protein
MPITPRSSITNHAVEFLDNIRIGATIGVQLIELGAAVYCPGNDLVFWLVGSGLTPEEIYEQDLSIIDRCNGLVAVPGYSKSKNCLREIERAMLKSLPIFFWDEYPSETSNQSLFEFIKTWTKENN